MKVLLVSNQHPNGNGIGNPIMYRLCKALQMDSRFEDVKFLPFYNRLSSFVDIRKSVKHFDIVHIHFGGLYALLIWISLIGTKTRKFITFHGTDIHAKQLKTAKGWRKRLKIRMNQWASFLSIVLFEQCGFVAKEMMNYVPKIIKNSLSVKGFVQPLGVDYSSFVPMDKDVAQAHLGLPKGRYVLFSDVSNTSIKRRDIAEAIVKELGTPYKILIMSGVKSTDVPYYINACDFALLTSDEEGSPNIIREVLSMNKPFFSVDAGDAVKQLADLENSAIISRNPAEAAETIRTYLKKPYVDNTRISLCDRLDFIRLNKVVINKYLK